MIISFLIGMLIGVLYFGGLYVTTQRINDVKSPGLLMITSMLLRMIILLIGLYYLAKTGIQSILIGFLGIMLVRFIMVFLVKKEEEKIELKG